MCDEMLILLMYYIANVLHSICIKIDILVESRGYWIGFFVWCISLLVGFLVICIYMCWLTMFHALRMEVHHINHLFAICSQIISKLKTFFTSRLVSYQVDSHWTCSVFLCMIYTRDPMHFITRYRWLEFILFTQKKCSVMHRLCI